MKNKWVFSGILSILLVFVFSACENGVQDVKVVEQDLPKANAVASVSAAKTTATGTDYVIVTWDAVEDVGQYDVVYQEEGKKTIRSVPGYAQNDYIYDATNGNQTANTDSDKWSLILSLSNLPLQTGAKVRFGVRTSSFSGGYNSEYSDVTWSDYITR
jgi:hypothetical protein